MSRKTLGLLLLLLACMLVGLALGQWFYGLFLKTVPPLAMSGFNMGAAHVAFLLYGCVTGIVIFVVCLLSLSVARFFAEPGSGG